MGFDDLFENEHRYRGVKRDHYYQNESRYPYDSHDSYRGHNGHLSWLNLFEKVKGNNNLIMIVIFAGIIVLILAIVLIIFLFPVILKLINAISETGIKGIIDGISGFLEKLWNGAVN